MSRRAAATSSSRFSLPSSAASSVAASAALRARWVMSSACSRASFSRSRYSFKSSSASRRCLSAASMLSRIALARLSRASWMRGNASLDNTHIVNPNTTSVQIISPRPGETRKLPESASGGCAAIEPSGPISLREEERDQAEDEGVEGDRLGEREAKPANRLELVLHLRLPGDRLDLLAEDEPDPDPGSDRAEPGSDAQRDRLAGVLHRGEVGGLSQWNQQISH